MPFLVAVRDGNRAARAGSARGLVLSSPNLGCQAKPKLACRHLYIYIKGNNQPIYYLYNKKKKQKKKSEPALLKKVQVESSG